MGRSFRTTKSMAEETLKAIKTAFEAHTEHPNNPSDAVRFWDQRTPYAIHPSWCALTLLAETQLDEDTRLHGSYALALHDVIEDTTYTLPADLTPKVLEMVEAMTFGSFTEERHKIFNLPPEIRLLKLIDKLSNLLDCSWMKPEKLAVYLDFTEQLAQDVEKHFGRLNCVILSKAIIAERRC
ncbi:MAG: hypothetical protein OQK12_18550 [Motiliproteus sp.]|nr:hypothetical protein [Motiliproteus sp.]MCW9053378.1 hypothetical protein [Motiliproteus sp.]